VESQVKGWMALFGGIAFIFGGIVAVEPVVVVVGIIMILVTLATFRVRKSIRDRYRAR
jgi:uncharacterized membrane protein HdeD (DUF308 family)